MPNSTKGCGHGLCLADGDQCQCDYGYIHDRLLYTLGNCYLREDVFLAIMAVYIACGTMLVVGGAAVTYMTRGQPRWQAMAVCGTAALQVGALASFVAAQRSEPVGAAFLFAHMAALWALVISGFLYIVFSPIARAGSPRRRTFVRAWKFSVALHTAAYAAVWALYARGYLIEDTRAADVAYHSFFALCTIDAQLAAYFCLVLPTRLSAELRRLQSQLAIVSIDTGSGKNSNASKISSRESLRTSFRLGALRAPRRNSLPGAIYPEASVVQTFGRRIAIAQSFLLTFLVLSNIPFLAGPVAILVMRSVPYYFTLFFLAIGLVQAMLATLLWLSWCYKRAPGEEATSVL